jgi:peptidyl-tRNA hydrolase, PTH1 family
VNSGPLMENLFLIVGLGNPGAEYARTRHNAGFQVVEELARRARADWALEKKFEARVAKIGRDSGRILLAEPQTFMNASGEAVSGLLNFYQVPLAQLLVVVDDADLPFGEIRLRPKGGSGGHHGLESIEQHLGSQEFARLKVGIGRKDGRREITGHVLGRFGPEELLLLEKVLQRAADQAECWATDGVEKAMNRFNGVVNSESKEA